MAAKYQFIAQELEQQLRQSNQQLQKLPTEAELCRRFGCSRQTVRSALYILEQKGLILRRQGSGAYPTPMAARASREIAVVLSSREEYLSPVLLRDIRKAASDADYSVLCLETGGSRYREGTLLSQLLRQRPAGILLEPITDVLGCYCGEVLEQIRAAGIPLVYLNGRYDSGFPAVLADESQGAELLLRQLTVSGHRSIAAILQWDDSRGLERFRQLTIKAGELGIRFREENCLWYARQERQELLEGDDGLLRRFQEHFRRDCTAAVCFSDEIAYRLQRYLRSLHTPMSLLSFDNSYLASSSEGSLTSLGFGTLTPGSAGVALLLNRIQGESARDVSVPYRLFVRKSG